MVTAGLKAAGGLLGPVLLAALLTIAVAPLSGWLRRKGLPAWGATGVTVVGVYVILLVILVGLTASVVKFAAILPEYASKLTDLVTSVTNFAEGLGVPPDQISRILSKLDVGRVVDIAGSVLSSSLGLLSNLLFLITLLFFVAAETTNVSGRLAALRSVRPNLSDALTSFVRATQKYLLVSTIFGGIVAVLDGLAVWVLGVPLPVLWALLSFLTNFIPNIGFVVGLIPPALLGLLSGGVSTMLWVIVAYCVLNVAIQTILQPRFVGDAVGLSPVVTFLSLALWAYVLGALGALLAVPMTLFVRSLLVDADPEERWWTILIGSRSPGPSTADESPEAAPPVASEVSEGR